MAQQISMYGSMLEPEFDEPFKAWKANQTPEGNAAILQSLQPVIEKGVKTHVGETNPILVSRARQLTLQGLRSYDPSRSRLQTHLYNQYQGLKRINRQLTQPVHIPERVQFDNYQLQQYTQELADKLGRDPTDTELANHSGFSRRRIGHIRKAQTGIPEGQMETLTPGFVPGVQTGNDNASQMWQEMVYDELDPLDQRILEHTLGMHDAAKISNKALAKKLGRSPGAISQRKARIQAMLDRESELSPFMQ